MPDIIKRDLKAAEMPELDAPVEQVTRIVGLFTSGGGDVVARSFGSGFFDPGRPGFLVTSAHNLVSSYGLASSVKIKGYTRDGERFSLWGLQFAVPRDHADAGIDADIAVVWLPFAPTVSAPVLLRRPDDGYFSAYLRAYNSDASFDLHEPQTSTFNALATGDRIIYQSASATEQMSGAPVIRGGHRSVVGVHKGIVDGRYVAARLDLNLLNAMYAEF